MKIFGSSTADTAPNRTTIRRKKDLYTISAHVLINTTPLLHLTIVFYKFD
jgi:hypothetical protein